MTYEGFSNGVEVQHDESVTKISALERLRDELAEKKEQMREKIEEMQAEMREKIEEMDDFLREVEEMKKGKLESEARLMSLKKKVDALVKEIEERNKRIRVEEELRDKIGEKDREIEGFRLKVEGFEKVKLQWPIIAGGAGSTVVAVAAAALIYVYCGKRR